MSHETGKLATLRAEAVVTVTELYDLAVELAGALALYVGATRRVLDPQARGLAIATIPVEDWQRARAALDAIAELERDWST